LIKKDYTEVSNPELDDALWDYQLKNKYRLGTQNIESEDFEVKIYRFLPNGEKVEGVTNITTSIYTPFVVILNLDTNADGEVNGNDQTVDLENGVITFPMLEPFRSVWFAEYDLTLGNDIIYEELNPDYEEYNPFYISVKMRRTVQID